MRRLVKPINNNINQTSYLLCERVRAKLSICTSFQRTSCGKKRTLEKVHHSSQNSSGFGKRVYLNCISAQNMPLFLPMLVSVELMASTFPWAVHKTGVQTTMKMYTCGKETVPQVDPRCLLTCCSDSNQHRGRVEAPGVRVDEHGDVAAVENNRKCLYQADNY